MQRIPEGSGWLVSFWGFVIGVMPEASTLLVYVSIAVGVLTGVVQIYNIKLKRKACKEKSNDSS